MPITHLFTPGLRFATRWTYQTRMPSGRMHWARLPLEPDDADGIDPQGAWWCSRRCAAVLLCRPWQAVRMPGGLPPQPEAHKVAQVLAALLPGWQVVLPAHAAQAPVQPCAQALCLGGSALLLLEPEACAGQPQPQHRFWAWVVGVELQEKRQRADPASRAGSSYASALLTVPFGWPMPGVSGYSARVRMYGSGLCHVEGLHGQWHTCRCLAVLALSASGAMAGRSDSALS